MLVRAIFLLLLAAIFCLPLSFADSTEWYKGANFYQIYPRSFKDSDNDGIGDLNGISSKLEYLKEIGIDAVWLSPIFASPMKDFGYDISDYYSIQPEYGTMRDFEKLARRCRRLGIRLILDFVPNHTSDQHKWFKASVNKEPGFEDFYIWHDGRVNETTGERMPPSNWLSVFRYSAWEWNEQRQQYYLHQFAIQQPDLNYRNPAVVEAMKDVLRFWMGKGVSGFRVDAIISLFEVNADSHGNYPDEPLSGECRNDPNARCHLKNIYTSDQEETYDMVYQWREVLEDFQKQNGGDTQLMMVEAYSTLTNMMRYYGDGSKKGSQLPFNFYLLSNVRQSSSAKEWKKYIEEYMKAVPADEDPNWVLGNHDQKRLASRMGEKRIDLYNILIKTLPGMAITYNGEELGMTDVIISWEDSVDPPACNSNETTYYAESRDPARTPMQWDDSKNAGFNRGKKPWLPINEVNYKCVNVKTERKTPRSHLNVYKRLVKIRNEAGLKTATYQSALFTKDILTYKRQSQDKMPIFVVLNFGATWKTIDLSSVYGTPERMKVLTASIESQYREGAFINATRLTIPDNVGLVLTTA